MKEIEAVVFDLGGVLVDWDPRHLYRKLFDDDHEIEALLDDLSLVAWHRAQHDTGARPMTESAEALALAHPDCAPAIRAWAERHNEMIGGDVAGSVVVHR